VFLFCQFLALFSVLLGRAINHYRIAGCVQRRSSTRSG